MEKKKVRLKILNFIILAIICIETILLIRMAKPNNTLLGKFDTKEIEVAEESGRAISIKKIVESKEKEETILYKNGIVVKYNHIAETQKIVKKLSQDEINEILELAEMIDENKKFEINTLNPVSKGTIITAYPSKRREIKIKWLYGYNYSDAAQNIKALLEEYNLL